MFRALVWKEWRQTALIRWGGIALGALLPLAFFAGAEFAKRGWLPTGSVARYSLRDLMGELFPAVIAFGLWPLIALMATAQALAGDRAAGTETFVLERPVTRGAVWRARLAASGASLLVVMLVTAALGVALMALTGSIPQEGWERGLEFAGAALAVALLAFLGGMAASTVLPPMPAVLAGAVLGGLPILTAAQLTGAFPFAKLAGVPVGAALSVLLLPACAVASWIVATRGEPAGRGSLKRGGAVLGGSLAAKLLSFLIAAPLAVRADAGFGLHYLVTEPAGRRIVLASRGMFPAGGSWLVDVASGKRVAFLAPPLADVKFNADGTKLAYVTASAALGAQSERERIEIRRTSDGTIETTIEVPENRAVGDLAWASGKIVAVMREFREGRPSGAVLELADPATRSWISSGFRTDDWIQLVEGDPLYARVPVPGVGPEGKKMYRAFRLRRIDVASGRVEDPLTDATGAIIDLAGSWTDLSPSGRYARINGRGDAFGAPRLADLSRGIDLPHPDPAPWSWGSNDEMVWTSTLGRRTRLFVAKPGAPPTVVREWTNAMVGVGANPGRTAFLVSVLPKPPGYTEDANRPSPDAKLFEGPAPVGRVPEEGVYRVSESRWQGVQVFSAKSNDLRNTEWAGPKTLARMGLGLVYLEETDELGKKRFVLGGEGDLR